MFSTKMQRIIHIFGDHLCYFYGMYLNVSVEGPYPNAKLSRYALPRQLYLPLEVPKFSEPWPKIFRDNLPELLEHSIPWRWVRTREQSASILPNTYTELNV